MGPLTDAERWSFDVRGYLVRRRVLDAGMLGRLNAAVDRLGLPDPGETIASQRFRGHLGADAAFRDLLDHPAVFDVVVELCGPHVRLDHAYGIVMSPGTSGLGLHGGGTPFDPAQYYEVRSDGIHCGLVAVQWALVDHRPGDGGFCCVPGSHKAAFRPPADVDRYAVEVPLGAGDVVVFTEALTHGTLPWRGPVQRRTLLYKYSPGNSSWDVPGPPDPVLVGLLTARQRRLLAPPSVAGHPHVP